MCMKPNIVFWDCNEKKYTFTPYRGGNIRYDKYMIVPCGKCPECRSKWRTQLAQRMRYELLNYNVHTEVCFLTLTINDEMMEKVCPGMSLDHAYFQKFIKRLRRHLEYHGYNKKIKYFMCGEYGENENHRPHFHVMLFGWKPLDDMLGHPRRSKKGYLTYECPFLEELWGAGFVNVGDVSQHTAPYMVKYIVKFSEQSQYTKEKEYIADEETGEIIGEEIVKKNCFTLGGRLCRKPYVVYPKKIMGIEYFLKNFRQILRNGFILDSNGKRWGIPRSFLKYAENTEPGSEMNELFLQYKARIELFLAEEKRYLFKLGLRTWQDVYRYYLEEGWKQREIYTSLKNKYR